MNERQLLLPALSQSSALELYCAQTYALAHESDDMDFRQRGRLCEEIERTRRLLWASSVRAADDPMHKLILQASSARRGTEQRKALVRAVRRIQSSVNALHTSSSSRAQATTKQSRLYHNVVVLDSWRQCIRLAEEYAVGGIGLTILEWSMRRGAEDYSR